MKNKKACNKALKHILCCLIILFIFVITITIRVDAKNEVSEITVESEDIVPLKPQLNDRLIKLERVSVVELDAIEYNTPRIVNKDINFYIETEFDTLNFFSEVFGFKMEYIKEDLISRSKNVNVIEPTNIASLKNKNGIIKKFDNIEYGIVEYFYDLMENHSEQRNKKFTPYKGDSEYIEDLIIYYTNIYTNVDTTLALSIGAAESGYYKVEFMLKNNNIYGGMNNHGLIKHENIELGVLKYIRLLSNSYFKQGLTDEYSIGKKYCPTKDNKGNKIASPHWINLVNTAKDKYKNYAQDITIEDLISY